MSKIKIKNVDYLDKFLNSILRFVGACKFDIDSERCIVRSQNMVARAFFTTNVMTAEEPISFCIGELQYLCKSIKTLKEFKESDDRSCVLNYNDPFIQLKDIVKFKISTIHESKVEEWLTVDLVAELTSTCGCKLTNVMMKKLASMSFMADESPKVYVYKEDDKIIGEIDDRTQDLVNSISIPLSTDITGVWTTPIITDLDSFRMWNLLDAKSIDVSRVVSGKRQAILVLAEDVNTKEDVYVKVKILGTELKK